MSIDTTNSLPSNEQPSLNGSRPSPLQPVEQSQWKPLRKRVLARAIKHSAHSVFGASSEGGAVYRWGIAAATGTACVDAQQQLSRLACAERASKKHATLNLQRAADEITHTLDNTRTLSPSLCATAVTWAAALPALSESLDQHAWWKLLSCLQQLRESVLQRSAVDTPAHLMIAGELGLTLAWRLTDLPSCKRLEKSSAEAIAAWCEHDDESVSAAITGGVDARVVLGSLIRCRMVLEKATKRKFKKQQLSVANELATWVAAMTTHTGSTAMSSGSKKEIVDDLPPHGLLGRAAEFDRESLEPAIAAALGKTQSGGRLAWEVCLPGAFHHSEDAKIAVMFPDWDVRRGRIHFDYTGHEHRLELFAGRTAVILGRCQSMIELDGEEQRASGDWELTCEFTDDDVHYLEIEQPWTGGILLQRQVMLVRDDRCVLFADSVLPKDKSAKANWDIRYHSRLPLAPSILMEDEPETRDMFFSDSRRRGLVMPLSASEWKVGPSDATLKTANENHLLLTARGSGSLCAPLWFDFQQRRFSRKRTWRQLTIGDELRIVGRDEAVGYRIQVGSEQWLVYRSFGEARCRTVLGKHLIADFFAARFDSGDGGLEELVTVDDNNLIDD